MRFQTSASPHSEQVRPWPTGKSDTSRTRMLGADMTLTMGRAPSAGLEASASGGVVAAATSARPSQGGVKSAPLWQSPHAPRGPSCRPQPSHGGRSAPPRPRSQRARAVLPLVQGYRQGGTAAQPKVVLAALRASRCFRHSDTAQVSCCWPPLAGNGSRALLCFGVDRRVRKRKGRLGSVG